jgi:hypothetical protein
MTFQHVGQYLFIHNQLRCLDIKKEGSTTRKGILVAMIVMLCVIPITSVAGDDNVPGDDLIETAFFGTVTDNETGLPIGGANIYAFDEDYQNYYGALTDQEGYYYFEVGSAGLHIIYANKQGYGQSTSIGRIHINDKDEVNFTLDPIHYEYLVYGEVVDQDTDELLSDVHITLYEMVGPGVFNPRTESTTNSSGGFSFRLDNGTYRLEFDKEGYFIRYHTWKVAGSGLHLTQTMQSFYQGIFGQVTDENGIPMPDVTISFENRDNKFYNTTDKDGNYEILVPYSDTYTLTAYADGCRPFIDRVTIPSYVKIGYDIQLHEATFPLIYQFLYYILTLLGLV